MRHDTVVSRRRRRHATAASSDFFCVPFGGRANGRVSAPPTPSATTTAARRRVRRLHLRHRLRRLRPALPASCAHLRRDVQLGFRRRLRRPRPRLGVPPGPRPSACGPDQSSHVVRWQRVCTSCRLYITSLRTKVLKEELLTTGTTNDERGWGSRPGSDEGVIRANRCGTRVTHRKIGSRM